MGNQPLGNHRRWVVISTVIGKITKASIGVYVIYATYVSGLEGLALAMVFGGGGYALVQTIKDWRSGRKPWLPIERVPIDDFESTPYQQWARLGIVLAKLTQVFLGVYLAVVLYRAGLTTLAYAFVFGGGGYALVKTISDWRDGLPPWQPSKRVQRLD